MKQDNLIKETFEAKLSAVNKLFDEYVEGVKRLEPFTGTVFMQALFNTLSISLHDIQCIEDKERVEFLIKDAIEKGDFE